MRVYNLREVCEQIGVTYRIAYYYVRNGDAPQPTYRIGKTGVYTEDDAERLKEYMESLPVRSKN